jgi:flagellar biogenesis protein FliO
MTHRRLFACALWLLIARGDVALAASAEAGASEHAAAPAEAARPVNLESDTPPPTPYDVKSQETVLMPESRSLVWQLGRTVLALAVVVGLFYLTAKLLLPRLLHRLPKGGGTHLKVVERLALDTRHTVVLVDVGAGTRLLLGTGDQGVQVLSRWETPGQNGFQTSMGSAREALKPRVEGTDVAAH